MVRQCAWCLCLINGAGERLSPTPLPKLYEASHGICGVCGIQWIAQAVDSQGLQGLTQRPEDEAGQLYATEGTVGYSGTELAERVEAPRIPEVASITELVLQLQRPDSTKTAVRPAKRCSKASKLRIL